jgi:hypothetical protein
MNYLKVYCNLIRKAENRTPPEGYTEKHHTFPKSIFGNNKRIVVLTSREHYIAHALLEKIYIKRCGIKDKKPTRMIHAHILMKSKGRYYNSHLYEGARIRMSESKKGKKPYVMTEEIKNKMSEYSKNRNEEHKKKLSESLKGRIPTNYGKSHSEETKRKIGQKNKGRKASEETRKKLSECRKGEKHFLYGKKRDIEIVNKIAEKKSKEFSIINPEGEIIRGKNITKFCKENNLDVGTTWNLLNYKRNTKSHKGYRAVPQQS